MAVKSISDHVSALKITAPTIEGLPAGEIETKEKDRTINVSYRNDDGTMIEIAFYHNSGHYWTMIAPKFDGGRFVTVIVSDVVLLHKNKVSRYGTKSLAQYAADWLPIAAQYLELPERAAHMIAKAQKARR